MNIRRPSVAGVFYPDDPARLREMVLGFLESVPAQSGSPNIKAIIVPHAGYIYSGQVAAYAYALVRECCTAKRFLILGPSHYVYFNAAATDTHQKWKTPLGELPIADVGYPGRDDTHAREHSIEVQLPFLQVVCDHFQIVPIVVGDFNPQAVSRGIEPMLDDNTMLIVSSDLSHYQPYEVAKQIDEQTMQSIEKLDYAKLLEEGDACGIIPLLVLVDIARRRNWTCRRLKYLNSGDTAGTRESVVGYPSFALFG